MRCYIQRTCCTCHTNVNVLMSVFASFIQGPWNPLGWKAPGACKGLMTGFRCYYPPTETPAIKGAEGEFSAWSTQVRSSFCCFRRPPQEWPRAQRKEEGKENNNTPNDNGMGETMLPNAVLRAFHLILTTTVWFYIFQMRDLGPERLTCSNVNILHLSLI